PAHRRPVRRRSSHRGAGAAAGAAGPESRRDPATRAAAAAGGARRQRGRRGAAGTRRSGARAPLAGHWDRERRPVHHYDQRRQPVFALRQQPVPRVVGLRCPGDAVDAGRAAEARPAPAGGGRAARGGRDAGRRRAAGAARRRSGEAIVTPLAIALSVAAVQPGSASAAVQSTQDKVRSALSGWFKSEGQARTRAREQARKAVSELIDFDALAKSTLGKKWDEIKPSDRSRYTAALKGAMEANYLAKMRQGKSSDVDRIRSEVTGEEVQGGKTV